VQPAKRNIVVFLMVLAIVGAAAVGLRSVQSGSTAVNLTLPVEAGAKQSEVTDSQPASTQEIRIPGQQAGPAGSELLVKMTLSVLAVAVIGVAAIYVSKKLLPKIANLPGKEIRVIETAYLGARKQLHLVEVGGRRVLIAATGENITMLSDVTEISGFPAHLAEGG
jgi:flagellar biogenesis protein FliO